MNKVVVGNRFLSVRPFHVEYIACSKQFLIIVLGLARIAVITRDVTKFCGPTSILIALKNKIPYSIAN